jgi:hypothetical protein
MIKISHRGNITGPNPELENHPNYLLQAINHGFQVEVDVWFVNNQFVLGHDEPQYEVTPQFIMNSHFWQHAKNIEALLQMLLLDRNLINCFYHQTDDVTLTSQGWIWTYPGKYITGQSIAVMPETVSNWDISHAAGVCTDYPYLF